MLRLVFAAAVFPLTLLFTARAADIAVSVKDQHGEPAADAVVELLPADGRALPDAEPRRHVIDQREEAFVPFVTAMRSGDQVQFTNSDRTRHHVYSFSPVKQFELVLNPGEKSQPVQFEKAGVVAIGCNIHDKMLAYAFVSETPWAVRTDAKGRATLAGVPKGKYRASVWHPRQEGDSPTADQTLNADDGAVSFTVELTPARQTHHKRHY
jgi:plastocyanin